MYTCISIWGTSIAYRRQADTEEDRLTAFHLEQVRDGYLLIDNMIVTMCSLDLYVTMYCMLLVSIQSSVKLMRGLLVSMMLQVCMSQRYDILQLYVMSSICSAG